MFNPTVLSLALLAYDAAIFAAVMGSNLLETSQSDTLSGMEMSEFLADRDQSNIERDVQKLPGRRTFAWQQIGSDGTQSYNITMLTSGCNSIRRNTIVGVYDFLNGTRGSRVTAGDIYEDLRTLQRSTPDLNEGQLLLGDHVLSNIKQAEAQTLEALKEILPCEDLNPVTSPEILHDELRRLLWDGDVTDRQVGVFMGGALAAGAISGGVAYYFSVFFPSQPLPFSNDTSLQLATIKKNAVSNAIGAFGIAFSSVMGCGLINLLQPPRPQAQAPQANAADNRPRMDLSTAVLLSIFAVMTWNSLRGFIELRPLNPSSATVMTTLTTSSSTTPGPSSSTSMTGPAMAVSPQGGLCALLNRGGARDSGGWPEIVVSSPVDSMGQGELEMVARRFQWDWKQRTLQLARDAFGREICH